jgi:hypothetical protein
MNAGLHPALTNGARRGGLYQVLKGRTYNNTGYSPVAIKEIDKGLKGCYTKPLDA